MLPNRAFVGLPKAFWANVRIISQQVGYTVRPQRRTGVRGQAGEVRVPSLAEMQAGLESLNMSARHIVGRDGRPTELGARLMRYFRHRADTLNKVVEPLLMNAEQAKELFESLQRKPGEGAPVPMNKQSGVMKRPAFFTGIINMLIEANLNRLPCNYNPQVLTTVTRNREPFRTLAHRIDGAFPGPIDPLAVWEIKEYYYTTTFGSRVADGIYETLLDGMELEEMRNELRVRDRSDTAPKIQHLLMVDAHFTWWVKGRSYLCRIIDMLHMGYLDEVLFGREVVDRLPKIVKGWVAEYKRRSG